VLVGYSVRVAPALAVGELPVSAGDEEAKTAGSSYRECRPATIRQYPSDDEHVRSAQPKVVAVIRDGLSRSRAFEELITTLDSSDVVAYVELASKMPTGLDGYLAHWVLPAGERRYVRIFIDFELDHDRLIETIAHELQHAIEVAKAPDVNSDEGMRKLFYRLDSGGCRRGCTETAAAVAIQKIVSRELRAQRRVQVFAQMGCGATKLAETQR